MQESQIVVENVVKRFGDSTAVETMNLSINAGEFLAIMGSSGCGKTTTLRMLAGLEAPSEGEIRLNGQRMNELKPHQRETPLVWQSLALFPFLNVIENVEFGLRMRNIEKNKRRQRALKWLKRMEIERFADRNIAQLSGGQQQRVALARALVTEPPVLLLDEPLSALDANLVVRMQSVLTQLQKELGITFIYVTHSQSEAFAMADRVVIMSAGKVEQLGTPVEIYRAPASRFVAEFVGANNIIQAKVESIEPDQLVCQSPIGKIISKVADNSSYKIGDDIELVVAADVIELCQESTGLDIEIAAKFIGEEFSGSVATLYFEAECGLEIRVQKQQRGIEVLELSPGKQVFLQWNAENVYCLPKR